MALPALVCDTSVVSNLGRRGGLEALVRRLAERHALCVPQEVERELLRDRVADHGDIVNKWFAVDRRPLAKIHEVLRHDPDQALDAGETAVLALGLELSGRVCVDERVGRRVARALKLENYNTINLLEMGLREGWMSDGECLAAVIRMKAAGFYCPKVLANDDFEAYAWRLR